MWDPSPHKRRTNTLSLFKKNHLRHLCFCLPPCSSPLQRYSCFASSHHVFTSFFLVLQWHLCLTHSDTYVVLLRLPSRAFGWGPLFVVDRIAVINVPSPDPSCSLLPQPSLCWSWCLNRQPLRLSRSASTVCVCVCLCAYASGFECLGGNNDVWERLGVCLGCLIIS